MAYADLIPVTGTILSVTGEDCCNRMVSLHTENGIVNFRTGPETMIVDCRQLRPGMRAVFFHDSSLPAPAIYPPQYQAAIVTVPGRNEMVLFAWFDENLIASDGSLQLNIGRGTSIRTANGQPVSCSPAKHLLLVYYTFLTRSIPPQTTPDRIIVLCKDPEEAA